MTVRTPMAVRRPRKSLIVVASNLRASESHARTLARSLRQLGVETSYLGGVTDAGRIAATVRDVGADAVEVCLEAPGGARLLRDLLRELTEIGRRDVSIVVHRVP
jgi:methylmalonyl-CoA mutase cobalamin-binding subunit